MKLTKLNMSALVWQNLSFILLILVQFFPLSKLSGQSQRPAPLIDEPVFVIRVEQIASSDDISYSSLIEKTYAPCSKWVGGSGGFTGTPSGFISNAGGLGGLKPKMGIPFYSKSISGSAEGSDGSLANVVTVGDGRFIWTEQLGDNKCTKQDDPSDQPSLIMSARFERTEKGARITFDPDIVSAGCATYIGFVSLNQMEVDPEMVRKFCTFEISNEELSNWKELNITNAQIFSDDNGRLKAVATLFADIESPIEVDVDIAEYNNWIPKGNEKNPDEAGNTINIKASVKSKDGKENNKDAIITFTLNNVSSEPGICLNGPEAEGLDMKFLEKDNPASRFDVTQTVVETIDFVHETDVVISSFDYGAYADLSVTAVDRNGKPVKVFIQGLERNTVFLPKADNGGLIADAWRAGEGVEGLPDSWDEAEVKGQYAKGDGLDLYAKYRGLFVLNSKGTPEYTRLKPREKAHFVIDKSNIFDFERWYNTSGIRAYEVNEALTRNHRVDYNSSSVSQSVGKYAVETESISGMVEPDPFPLSEEDKLKGLKPGVSPTQYGYTAGETPRETDRCRVFPDRIHAMLERVIAMMRKAVDNPTAPENAEEIANLNSLGKSLDAIRQRLNAIDEKEINILSDMMVKLTSIHEMGHACGIDGHLNAIGKEDEDMGRVPSCPMNYLDIKGRRLFILDRALGGEGRFCSSAPDNCWNNLNVK